MFLYNILFGKFFGENDDFEIPGLSNSNSNNNSSYGEQITKIKTILAYMKIPQKTSN